MVSGGLTEIELISIALEKLQIRSSETFADIGCGTGSVSIAASKKARSLFSKIWDAKSNKCLMDGSQQVAVTSLLRRHSPSEAKKDKKSSTPTIYRAGWSWFTSNVCCLLAASRERRDNVRSANLYGFFNVRTCWAANYNLRHSGVEQPVDLLVASICVARYDEGVDHVIIH